MLRKEATGGAAAAGLASPSKLARRGSGGAPPSLLLSTRSLPGLFSRDVPVSPTAMGGEQSHCGGIGSQGAGLAGVLVAGEADGGYLNKGRVLLGMRLRVQLPPPPPPGKGPGDLPGSPIEFGVKNRDVQLALLSPVQRSPLSSAARRSEVEELAEDYTCVIARGPNPKMTHIFEDRVIESRASAGAGDGDACCLLSSCCGCDEDALLLQRCEKASGSSKCDDQEALFGKRTRDSSDASVELKPLDQPT